MKAKTVNENIGFERNRNPKTSIGVGKLKEAFDLLEVNLNGRDGKIREDGGNPIYKINANSLDDIKITFTEQAIKVFMQDSTIWEWTFKYRQVPQCILVEEQGRSSAAFIVKAQQQSFFRDPTGIKLINKKLFEIEKTINDSYKIAQAALEGINSKFKTIWVFELVSKDRA